ncbi:hypothetical protein RYX56_06295 [Alkalihalophilus lindianensis]|uniref:Uncharacterized protein n=1 Tax=Alkalihalophilus lindianensis TaxID=1630542 RepID=A0ABU3X7V6_9BACI|nr:hypothetical protein [Alkalihalophilus lindianensis]MDV2683981.1 hypothetical protein [Alkalihalophilus lindianensis]
MKKVIFLVLPLAFITIAIWSTLISQLMDNNEIVTYDGLNVVKDANMAFSNTVKESKRDKYAGEEGYQKAVKNRVITTEYLIGNWEGNGEISNDKAEINFSMNELSIKIEGEPVMTTSYTLSEEYNLQFLDLIGEYGRTSVKIEYIDDNAIKLYFPNTSDNLSLVRADFTESYDENVTNNNVENKTVETVVEVIPDSSLQYNVLNHIDSKNKEITI